MVGITGKVTAIRKYKAKIAFSPHLRLVRMFSACFPLPMPRNPEHLPAGTAPCSSVKVYFPPAESNMPISEEFLKILVCPICLKPLIQLPADAGLKCQQCRRVYPLRDNIPVMLPEEATIAPE
jgi:uncharacterized protein YbaR (Trm112 family)